MMNTTKSRLGLVLDLVNVQASDRAKKYNAIDANEEKVEVKMDCMKDATTSDYPTKIQTYMSQTQAIRGLRAGIYSCAYLIVASPFETNAMRENAYPRMDQHKHMDLKERFNAEPHPQDERIQHPEKWGYIDTQLYWFVSQVNRPEVQIYYIDISVEHPQAHSVTDDYFKPVPHRPYNQEEADWAIALGVTREVAAAYLDFYKTEFPPTWEHHMYLMANGGMEPGTTPDAQVVPCPEDHRPTHASPATVGSKENYAGEYRLHNVDAAQMTCSHCGADLSPVFNCEYKFIPFSYLTSNDDEEQDEYEGMDIFTSLAGLTTEININDIDCSKIANKVKVPAKPELVKKNSIVEHKVTAPLTRYLKKPEVIKATREAANAELFKERHTVTKKRIHELTDEQKARAAKWNKPLPVENRRPSEELCVPGCASIEEIREKHNPKTPKKDGTLTDYAKKAIARRTAK